MSTPESATAIALATGAVTSVLTDDREAYLTCAPGDSAEAAYMIAALSRLCARMVTALADAQGRDPLEAWQAATMALAAHPSSN